MVSESEGVESPRCLRPTYHFTPPTGRVGDPNGLCWHDGIYHLFYLHLLAFSRMAWGYGAVVLGAPRQRGHGPLERGADGFLSGRALRQPSLLERVFSDYQGRPNHLLLRGWDRRG